MPTLTGAARRENQRRAQSPPSSLNAGSNQSGLSAYNQRLVLSLVYTHGNLAKTDIARMTGLSAQTGSVIMRELEAEDLIVKGEPIRGKVGQPSVPLSINPDGAFFIGLKVGGAAPNSS
jgi:CRP-like cAMP-binding protein